MIYVKFRFFMENILKSYNTRNIRNEKNFFKDIYITGISNTFAIIILVMLIYMAICIRVLSRID